MRKKYIDIPDHARRDFIKWTVGLGAALGLRPWKIFEIRRASSARPSRSRRRARR